MSNKPFFFLSKIEFGDILSLKYIFVIHETVCPLGKGIRDLLLLLLLFVEMGEN